jgi:hypothetical protein
VLSDLRQSSIKIATLIAERFPRNFSEAPALGSSRGAAVLRVIENSGLLEAPFFLVGDLTDQTSQNPVLVLLVGTVGV